MDQQRSRTGTARAFASLAALLLAGGCGMYGDLYLEEPARQAPAEIEEPAPFAAPGMDAAEDLAGDEDVEEREEPEKPRATPPDSAGDDAAGRP